MLLPQMAISPTVTSAKTLLQALAMTREILDNNQIHPAVQATVNNNHADIVAEVQEAIANNQIVIVGMAQNPAPKRPASNSTSWDLIMPIWSTAAISACGVAAMP